MPGPTRQTPSVIPLAGEKREGISRRPTRSVVPFRFLPPSPAPAAALLALLSLSFRSRSILELHTPARRRRCPFPTSSVGCPRGVGRGLRDGRFCGGFSPCWLLSRLEIRRGDEQLDDGTGGDPREMLLQVQGRRRPPHSLRLQVSALTLAGEVFFFFPSSVVSVCFICRDLSMCFVLLMLLPCLVPPSCF